MAYNTSQDVEVRHIVDLLDTHATRCEQSVGWVSIWPFENSDAAVISDSSVYRGQAGIALFLSANSYLNNCSKSKRLAEKALYPLEHLSTKRIEKNKIGGLTGIGSMIFSLMECSKLLNRGAYLSKATAIATSIGTDQIQDGRPLDLVSGYAGLAVVLAEMLSTGTERDTAIRQRLRSIAELLVRNSVQCRKGIGWETQQSPPQTGFAHGASGIAYALFIAGEELSSNKYTRAAKQALAFEDSIYNSDRKNWAKDSQNNEYQSTWCWGAEGILLSRYGIKDITGELILPEEAELILQGLIDTVPERHSLCHGGAGRAVTLSYIHESTPADFSAGEVVDSILNNIREHRLIHGFYDIPGLKEFPASRLSLFRGIAGIGYANLYSQHQSELANPLLLQSSLSHG